MQESLRKRAITIKIILISGKAQHGKDTFADMLSTQFANDGKKVIVAHYADYLKHLCRSYFGWDGSKDLKGRALLQRIGTEVVRAIDPDFWTDVLVHTMRVLEDEFDVAIIPDCRFPNEVMIPKCEFANAIHIRIVRPNFDNGLTEEQKNHPSEIALDDYKPDIAIVNDGTLHDLYTKAEDLYRRDFSMA